LAGTKMQAGSKKIDDQSFIQDTQYVRDRYC
jgi:hypothetical protein